MATAEICKANELLQERRKAFAARRKAADQGATMRDPVAPAQFVTRLTPESADLSGSADLLPRSDCTTHSMGRSRATGAAVAVRFGASVSRSQGAAGSASMRRKGWLSPLLENVSIQESERNSADSPTNPTQTQPKPNPQIERYSAESPHMMVSAEKYVTFYGSLIAAILRRDRGTVGRVHLALKARYATEGQSGIVAADDLRPYLEAAFPALTWKRIRQILNVGEGVYWTRDNIGRLHLTGAAALCQRLGIDRLQGARVAIPLNDLTGCKKRATAALLGAFIASRNDDNPISQATVFELTGISDRSQRDLIRRHPDIMHATANYAIDDKVIEPSTEQEHAYKHRGAAFVIVDVQGKQGEQGASYTARQLPNSYHPSYRKAVKGRKRKVNKRLADRVTNGARGNGWKGVERVFFTDGATMARAKQSNVTGRNLVLKTGRTRNGAGLWITY